MRIMVVEPRGQGGMAHYAYQLCEALAEAGAEVELVTSTEFELADLDGGFRVSPVLELWSPTSGQPVGRSGRVGRAVLRARKLVRRAGRAARYVAAWIKVVRLATASRPDVVQFGKVEFPFEALFLQYLRARGLRLADICHEWERRESRAGLLAPVEHQLMTRAFTAFHTIFLHSAENVSAFRDAFPVSRDRLRIVPHGNEFIFRALRQAERPDLRDRYGIADGEPVVLFFGNLTPSKGLPELVAAYDRAERPPGTRLLVVGFPHKEFDLDGLRREIGARGLDEEVIVDARYVPIEEVGWLVDLATVVAFPYRTATASGAVQVAAAFSRAAVVTDVGGLPDMVADGLTGLVVPPNDEAALAGALGELLSAPERARQLGANAYERAATEYSWGRVAEAVLDAYGGRPAPPA